MSILLPQSSVRLFQLSLLPSTLPRQLKSPIIASWHFSTIECSMGLALSLHYWITGQWEFRLQKPLVTKKIINKIPWFFCVLLLKLFIISEHAFSLTVLSLEGWNGFLVLCLRFLKFFCKRIFHLGILLSVACLHLLKHLLKMLRFLYRKLNFHIPLCNPEADALGCTLHN